MIRKRPNHQGSKHNKPPMASFSSPSSTNEDAQRLSLTLIRAKWEGNWKKGKARTKKEKRFNKSYFYFTPLIENEGISVCALITLFLIWCAQLETGASQDGWSALLTYILSFLPAAFMTLLSEGNFLSGLKLPAVQFIVPAIRTRWPRFAVPIYSCPGWFYPTG